MRICFFTKHEITWGSSRERIGVYLDYIKKRKHTYKIIYCIPDKLSKIWIGGRDRYTLFDKVYSFWCSRIFKHIKLIWLIIIAKRFNVILIQKANLLYPFICVLKLRNKNIIFDFDDQYFWDLGSIQKNKVGFSEMIKFWRKGIQHPAILRLYSHIIAGNKYLANIAVAVKGKDSVTVIPTPIDCNLYYPKDKTLQNKTIIIGWAGSGENHLRHLELLVGPLKELIRQYDIAFKLVGAMHSRKIKTLFGFLNSRFICIDWVKYLQLPEIIQTFDIGVMPLRDDDESRGKCGFKTLQYMASGVPVIISPVGVNKEIIKDGINGFLAKDDLEWIKKISILIEDKELRNKFALKARETVKELYSIDKTCKAFIDVMEKFS